MVIAMTGTRGQYFRSTRPHSIKPPVAMISVAPCQGCNQEAKNPAHAVRVSTRLKPGPLMP